MGAALSCGWMDGFDCEGGDEVRHSDEVPLQGAGNLKKARLIHKQ